jgi:glycosyltransferase involved in cell wall biosynthesis
MIESMAVGTPVVSFDVTSAREMLDGKGAGLVSPLDDFPGMVENVLRLLRNPALARRMGTHGADAAGRLFRRDQAVARYEEVLDRLAAQSVVPGR